MHQPVLLNEVLYYLRPEPAQKILDCTIGGGGHAQAILQHITPGGILIGIDCDKEALKIAASNLKKFRDNIYLLHANFKDLETHLSSLGIKKVDGALFDLGVSSFQLEDAERGFSIKLDGPLDMRMDKNQKLNAAYIVNNLCKKDLSDILKKFGEERYSHRIAEEIVKRRPITRTGQLSRIVLKAISSKIRHVRLHPATKTFQALRIAVNKELESLELALDGIVRCVKKGGRICVISFHSLEDRIVKNKFKHYSKEGLLKIVTKKPITPKEVELLKNRRARSAKLRVAEVV